MQIEPKHVKTKKRVGTLDGLPVVEMALHGGLHVLAVQKNGRVEFLGTGSHRGVARFTAQKTHKDLVLTELSKGDWVEPAILEAMSGKYIALTARLNELTRG
jgi:hypothetical protein